jgi:hypothetical protein
VKDFSAMTKTSFADSGALMSPRTAKYVEALMREGDNFDCQKWLQQVREEEAQAKRAFSVPGEHAATEIATPSSTSNFRNPVPNAGRAVVLKAVPVSRPIWRLHREGISKGPKRWLEKVRDAWNDFQATRARDAVYGYLKAVFAIVEHYKVRRRTKRLLRHAFKFANLAFDRNADLFIAVIRCTCNNAVDSKTISKWARALRYVAHCKKPRTPLKTFVKNMGGINACAAGYSKLRRRSSGRN